MKKLINILLVVMLLLISSSCTNNDNKPEENIIENNENNKPQETGKKKELNNVVFAEIEPGAKLDEEFIKQLNKFTINFYQNAYTDKNNIVSPLSLYIALGMIRHMANGETKTELDNLIGISSDDFDSNIIYLLNSLKERDEYAKRLISNSFWLNKNANVKLNENYANLLNKRYQAIIKDINFDNEGKNEINKWIEDSTNGVFKDFIDQIDPNMIFYLINTIYFQDFWISYITSGEERDFDEDVFTNYDNKKVLVEMFDANQDGNYYKGENCLAFRDPMFESLYRGDLIIIVPNDGVDVKDVANNLTPEVLNDIYDQSSENYHYAKITAAWPKFKYDYDVDLLEVLPKMGINKLFDPKEADLSNGVVGDENIYIGEAKQKVEIEVNGKGITAAAVTMMGGMGAGGYEPPTEEITIMADKPFIYIINDPIYSFVDDSYSIDNVTYFIGTIYNLEGEEASNNIGNEIDEFKVGQYKLAETMKVRTKPDYEAEVVEFYKVPYEYRDGDKALIRKGTSVEITRIKKNDDNSYWGKISSNCWICIKDKDGTYYVER